MVMLFFGSVASSHAGVYNTSVVDDSVLLVRLELMATVDKEKVPVELSSAESHVPPLGGITDVVVSSNTASNDIEGTYYGVQFFGIKQLQFLLNGAKLVSIHLPCGESDIARSMYAVSYSVLRDDSARCSCFAAFFFNME